MSMPRRLAQNEAFYAGSGTQRLDLPFNSEKPVDTEVIANELAVLPGIQWKQTVIQGQGGTERILENVKTLKSFLTDSTFRLHVRIILANGSIYYLPRDIETFVKTVFSITRVQLIEKNFLRLPDSIWTIFFRFWMISAIRASLLREVLITLDTHSILELARRFRLR